MRQFSKLFRKYEIIYCDVCCRDSFVVMNYNEEDNSYYCEMYVHKTEYDNAFIEDFNYRQLCIDLIGMSETDSTRLIARYMLYSGATDEETYDSERIYYYYNEIMDKGRYMSFSKYSELKLFVHYPFDRWMEDK